MPTRQPTVAGPPRVSYANVKNMVDSSGVTRAPVATPLRRIGDAAEATGLTPRAIRYYEEIGLLKPAAHLTGANRRYDDEDIERLVLIKRLREVVGLSLADIHVFLETEDE